MSFIRVRDEEGKETFINKDFILSVETTKTRGQFILTQVSLDERVQRVKICKILSQAGREVAQTEMLHKVLRGEI